METTSKRNADRKTQIIDLALQLIRLKGYVAFSYDDLSRQLGVTKASIHYHFEKKEDLGIAVCERLMRGLTQLAEQIDRSGGTAMEKLWRLIDTRVCSLEQQHICPVSSLQSDYESLPDALRDKVRQVSEFELNGLQRYIEEAQKNGELNAAADSSRLAVTILSAIKGSLQYHRVLGVPVTEQVMAQLKDLLAR